MLLITRYKGEAVKIGPNVVVKVVSSTRSRVMLAVSAPRELEIKRILGKADYKKENTGDANNDPPPPDTE